MFIKYTCRGILKLSVKLWVVTLCIVAAPLLQHRSISHKHEETPKINCVSLQISYQIIDRIPPHPTLSGLYVLGMLLCEMTWTELRCFRRLSLPGELMFTVPYHGPRVILHFSSVFILSRLLSYRSAHLSLPVSSHFIPKHISLSHKSSAQWPGYTVNVSANHRYVQGWHLLCICRSGIPHWCYMLNVLEGNRTAECSWSHTSEYL